MHIVSRGKPLPHALPDEKKIEVGLMRDLEAGSHFRPRASAKLDPDAQKATTRRSTSRR